MADFREFSEFSGANHLPVTTFNAPNVTGRGMGWGMGLATFRELDHAENTVVAYWLKYCPGAVEKNDFETLAKVHNGKNPMHPDRHSI